MNNGRIRGTQASIIVSYRELWTPVLGGNGTVATTPPPLLFLPGASGLPQLDALASLYESYRLLSGVKVEFKSAAGSVNNGSMIAGVDYDARDIVLGYSSAASMMPKFVGSITKNMQLTVDHTRAMNKKWMFSAGQAAGDAAFAVVYSNTASLSGVGDIWCEYTVEFISPKLTAFPAIAVTTLIDNTGLIYGENRYSSPGVPFKLDVEPNLAQTTPTAIYTDFSIVSGSPLPPGYYQLIVDYVDSNQTLGGQPTASAIGNPFINILSNPVGTPGAIRILFQCTGFAVGLFMRIGKARNASSNTAMTAVLARLFARQ